MENRGIEHLIHFTPAVNLLSIFAEGKLLSRALLELPGAGRPTIEYFKFMDCIRFDDKKYINLSVQHPNSSLFLRFRQKTAKDSHICWCVLKIDKKYVYQVDTLFSVTNAANSHNRKNVGITGDIKKFRMMFAKSLQVVTTHNSKIITRDSLKDKYPTDEQAEVLVMGEIAAADILQVCFKNEQDLATGKAALNDYDTSKFTVDASLFKKLRI
ncbi:MAG: DUF4433 domain-containing protein [Dysgonamonadaceae bacterium]|nr:DUF4433 domain-containing protein [Dysgonamonadaceae bacterium]